MPQFASASADDCPVSRGARIHPISHARSMHDLRRSEGSSLKRNTSRRFKRRCSRSTSSEPLTEVSYNAKATRIDQVRRPRMKDQLSSSTSNGSLSNRDSYHCRVDAKDASLAYPSPPPETTTQDTTSATSLYRETIEGISFPLQPGNILPVYQIDEEDDVPRTLRPRQVSNATQLQTPSPDRFIPLRKKSKDLSEAFRLSKSPDRLTPQERLTRHHSASPNPFGSLHSPRVRNQRQGLIVDGSTAINRAPSRTVGTTNVTAVPQEPLASQNRQISAGAVWNVGGGGRDHAALSSPIRGISNGRGGFNGSGSNAPLYASRFLDDVSPDQNMERMEGQLSAALNVDQASRVLNFSQPPYQQKSVIRSSVGVKSNKRRVEPQTTWKEGAWVEEGPLNCK